MPSGVPILRLLGLLGCALALTGEELVLRCDADAGLRAALPLVMAGQGFAERGGLRLRPALAGETAWISSKGDPCAAWARGDDLVLVASIPTGLDGVGLRVAAAPERVVVHAGDLAPGWRLLPGAAEARAVSDPAAALLAGQASEAWGLSAGAAARLLRQRPLLQALPPPLGSGREQLLAPGVLLRADPGLASRVRAAWLASWSWMAAHPVDSVGLVLASAPGEDRSALLDEAERLASGLHAVAGLDAAWWQRHHQACQRLGLASALPASALLAQPAPVQAVAVQAPPAPVAASAPAVLIPAGEAREERRLGRPLLGVLLGLLAVLAALAWHWRRAHRRQLREETDRFRRASQAQRQLLPHLPELAGWYFHVHFHAAESVSGDFYQIGRLRDGRLLAVVGDVSGHGMDAALLATAAMKDIQLRAGRHDDLAALLADCDASLKREIGLGRFITAVAIAVDATSGRVECVRAGHPPALLLGKDGVSAPLGQAGSALGVGAPAARPVERGEILPGSRLILFTDGLVEARARGGEEFGIERLAGALRAAAGLAGQACVNHLAAAVAGHGTVQDDATVLLIGRSGD